ncbi:hypothetical protein ACWF95_34135 [Streptomyces vinaceus]
MVALLLLGGPAVAAVQAAPAHPAAPMACPIGPAGEDCRKAEDAAKASPSPSPSNDPCALLRGQPAYDYCTRDPNKGGAPSLPSDNPLDPLQSVADASSNAAGWTIDKLGSAAAATSETDFTSEGFLKQYAIVFAGSTILTLVLWLVAVGKRAVRGVSIATAFGEAVGLLWLAVIACAFTPLVLYVVTSAVDAVTNVLTGEGSAAFFKDFAASVRDSKKVGGGPLVQIILALVSTLAAGVLWLELAIRAAALYVGAVLGTVVYSGLVDKDLWKAVRKWAGIMGAIIMTKPIIMIVLGLASSLTATPSGQPDALNSVIAGLAIIMLSIVGSVMIYRFIPGLGDDIVSSRRDLVNQMSRRGQQQSPPPPRSGSHGISQGISTHSQRQPAATSSPSGGMGGPGAGMGAHASRPTGQSSQQTPQPPSRGGNQGPTP